MPNIHMRLYRLTVSKSVCFDGENVRRNYALMFFRSTLKMLNSFEFNIELDN